MHFGLKRVIAAATVAIMTVTSLASSITTVSAADTIDSGQCGESVYWTLDSDGKLTISGTGEMATPFVENNPGSHIIDAYKISDYIDTYTYKQYKEKIKKVVIENGVTSIGFCAFYNFSDLVAVFLPSSIIKFEGVGYNCIPDINSANAIDSYASYAFAECTSLKELTLSNNMTAIGNFAFYGCTSLESVEIPKTIKDFGAYSFAKCSKLKDITLQTGLTAIGPYAFYDTAVENIFIPKTINDSHVSAGIEESEKIAGTFVNGAFNNCEKLSSVIFEDGIENISYASFHNCPFLKKITIPSSVTNMKYAFVGCDSLEEAYIEDGVQIKEVNKSSNFDGSFSGCENLKTLELSDGILDLGYLNASWNANCNSLENLYLHGISYTRMGGIPLCNDFFKFHCYTDSSIYSSTSIPNDRKVNIEETISSTWNNLKNTLNKAESLNENDYTPESYQALKNALEEANQFNESTTSILPMKWATEDITTAINNLVAYDANYTSVDEALAKADKLDLSKYTDESANALKDAINAVVRDLDITKQSDVDAFAKAINDAIDALKEKPVQSSSQTTTTTTAPGSKPSSTSKTTTATTRSPSQVAKDKKNAENKVKQAKITHLKAKSKSKKKITVSWKKVKKAVGYQVQVSKKKNFKNNLFDKFTTKKKITFKKKLKSGKTYYVRVRAYATYKDAYGKPQKVYSKWIKKVRKVNVK